MANMIQAIETFIANTNNARSLEPIVKKNVVFLLNNIKETNDLNVMENELYELENTHKLTLGKVSVAYSKKLNAFNERLATWIHKSKEKKVKNTNDITKHKATDHPFIAMLKYLKISGKISKKTLQEMRCAKWAGGRQFSNLKGDENMSNLMKQIATTLKDSNELKCRLLKQGNRVYGVRIATKPYIAVCVGMNSGYQVDLLDRGHRRTLASFNEKEQAKEFAAKYTVDTNVHWKK